MHRDQLFDIAIRWLNDDLRDDDGRRLTEIFLFESAVSAPCVQDFMLRFFTRLYGGDLGVERVQYKNVLRERFIEHVPAYTARIRQLVMAYRESPEEFFPGMPVDAIALYASGDRLVSVSRIKRPARVAEKASFRMADALAGKIRREAEVFASARALVRGIPLGMLISTEAQMRADFVEAERVVAAGFRNGEIRFDRDSLTINDIIGFKVIGDERDIVQAEIMLAREPGITVVEREDHRGHYNATNLLLDIELPSVAEIIDQNRDRDWAEAAHRGLDPATAKKNFEVYVESGARVVRTELILTTYPELIESELGRSLHELRILRLRERQPYSGQIAQNARYLIEFLFALAYAPTTTIDELPVKMWGRYLPDTVLAAVSTLFGAKQNGLLKWFLPV
ncbi:MAG: hypothetical protein MUF54_01820 [Polyangiaceae bacterium]|jgi:hypothetical protein|nr:hypothetical protein [Polyangiaceae bacterium]